MRKLTADSRGVCGSTANDSHFSRVCEGSWLRVARIPFTSAFAVPPCRGFILMSWSIR